MYKFYQQNTFYILSNKLQYDNSRQQQRFNQTITIYPIDLNTMISVQKKKNEK